MPPRPFSPSARAKNGPLIAGKDLASRPPVALPDSTQDPTERAFDRHGEGTDPVSPGAGAEKDWNLRRPC